MEGLAPTGKFFENEAAEAKVENWDTNKYLQHYYPELDLERVLPILERLRAGQEKKNFSKTDDVCMLLGVTPSVADKIGPVYNMIFLHGIEQQYSIDTETLENLCILEFQTKVAKRLLKDYPEDHIEVLDIGGGPSLYQHIALSLEAGSIVHSEFLKENRDEIQRWLNGESSHNWDSYFLAIQKLLKSDDEYQRIITDNLSSENDKIKNNAEKIARVLNGSLDDFKNHLRECIGKNVVFVDVSKEDLALANPEKQYDVVSTGQVLTANFTLESISRDKQFWVNAMKHTMNKVKAGGHLVITAVRNAKFYSVGDKQVEASSIDASDMAKLLTEDGLFEVLDFEEIEGGDRVKNGYDGMMFVHAKKRPNL